MSELKLQHKNVFVALCAAQGEMESVTKSAANGAFKKPDGTISRYANLASVVDAVRPALSKNGLSFYHQIVECLFVHGSAMRTTLSHGESDTHVYCDVPLIITVNSMQGMKSATTYAKRVGLESVTGVAPEDDDDGNAAVKAKPAEIVKSVPKAVIDKMNEEEREFLANIANEIKIPLAASESVAACELYEHHKAKLDVDEQVALWALFDSKQRSEIKKGGFLKQQKDKQ